MQRTRMARGVPSDDRARQRTGQERCRATAPGLVRAVRARANDSSIASARGGARAVGHEGKAR